MTRFFHRLNLEPLEDRTLLSTCTVKRFFDSQSQRGTLRYCIRYANQHPGPDEIVFANTGTIQLQSALPDLQSEVTITGPGEALLFIDSRDIARGFAISGSATISGLTIKDGRSGRGGAGIYNTGTAHLSRVLVTSGVTYDYGNAPGAGIYNGGTMVVSYSTVTNNLSFGESGGQGGGIYNVGNLTVSNSTIKNNRSYVDSSFCEQTSGGGIYNGPTGVVSIHNSTISQNTADDTYCSNDPSGGGIYNEGAMAIRHSTIVSNAAWDSGKGGGIYNAGTLNMRNSILGPNASLGGPDLWGTLTGSGYNLVSNPAGGSGYVPTDILNVNPLLGPLQDNGGPTFTHALLPGSPAIDAGDNTDAPEFDQRGPGYPRIVNGTIDIGAFEVQATGAPVAPDFLAILITANTEEKNSLEGVFP